MRSWNTLALLAAIGLCGLGSLFAQNPLLPMASPPSSLDPTPIAPQPEVIHSPTLYPEGQAPTPGYESMEHLQMQEHVLSDSPVMESSSSMGCHGCAPAPVASCNTCAEPAPVSTCNSCAAPQPVMVAPTCGCQGGSGGMGQVQSGYGQSSYGQMGYGQSYSMGSGSGVASGLLSPNANSGGLHTRYPYYNYRHPWYYQGPPSQNVTIVW